MKRLILAATVLGSSMAFIDGTVINIALPVMQIVLFGYAINTDVRHIPMVVFDQDASADSRATSIGAKCLPNNKARITLRSSPIGLDHLRSLALPAQRPRGAGLPHP